MGSRLCSWEEKLLAGGKPRPELDWSGEVGVEVPCRLRFFDVEAMPVTCGGQWKNGGKGSWRDRV